MKLDKSPTYYQSFWEKLKDSHIFSGITEQVRASRNQEISSIPKEAQVSKNQMKNPGIELSKMGLFLSQILLRFFAIGGGVHSVFSDTSWYQNQVQHGAQFPLEAAEKVRDILSLWQTVLSEIPEDANFFEKIWTHYENGKEIAAYISQQVQEILESISTAETNISEYPLESLSAGISVGVMYYVASEIVGIIRLGDRDTLSSRVRKRTVQTLKWDLRSSKKRKEQVIELFENQQIPIHEKIQALEKFVKISKS